jgi:hypothetical protein
MLPTRILTRAFPVTLAVVSIGCTADAPVAPRMPLHPSTLVAPTVTVTNTDDAGAGSLRLAIVDAPAGATIQFDAAIAGKTIVLSTGRLEIDKALTIAGPTTGGIAISGGLTSGVIQIGSNGNVVLRNLSVVDGRDFFAAGVRVAGKLVLDAQQ